MTPIEQLPPLEPLEPVDEREERQDIAIIGPIAAVVLALTVVHARAGPPERQGRAPPVSPRSG